MTLRRYVVLPRSKYSQNFKANTRILICLNILIKYIIIIINFYVNNIDLPFLQRFYYSLYCVGIGGNPTQRLNETSYKIVPSSNHVLHFLKLREHISRCTFKIIIFMLKNILTVLLLGM